MGFWRSTPQPQMKPITLPIAELKPALVGLGKVIHPRPALAVLSHIKIERTSDGWIALTSTDLDRFVTMRLEHPNEGPAMAVLIPYDQLMQITKNSGKDERLHIEASPTGPIIKFSLADKLGEQKVKPIPVDEFPATPRIKTDAMSLTPDLRRCIHEAMDCASSDNTRYVLNGVLIDASNPKAHYVVGTDGKHLYSANSFSLPLKHSVIIPSHKFLGWKEFNNDGEWQMKADDKNIQLASRRWRYISKTIDGKYPDWRVPIPNPKETNIHLSFDPTKLEAIIKLVQRMPCHDSTQFHTIGLEWKQGQFSFLGKDKPEDEWTKIPVSDVKGEGPEITILCNRRLLIKAFEFGLNTISLSDYLSCLRFHNKGKQMIVMPLRPAGDNTPQAKTPPGSHQPNAGASITTNPKTYDHQSHLRRINPQRSENTH